ncbi:CCA tRNA nucleotidyltransferase [Escovopsis weberi]|uniref:CCA tRNA nucleotidyltransferase n=1 Tax=Escovopsis weberi TaxID=150374 RepID=A0A0M8MXC7_ESCWE|nr:CCA tRNA nucleotidyltransferase [Escovopsis weberi]
MTEKKNIRLTPREQQLRHLLLDVASSIDASKRMGEPVVLRWAGGWVRDKLLGVESHDIDVAINVMTGQTFAQHIFEHCKSPTIAAAHGIGEGDVGNLHKVASNPDKSKHLETAMVKLFGLDLDFVNLRKETYAEDSRNPQMEFGTAEEDALRRDATINALFYNLHTEELENFTGGLDDLARRIIRTPLEPLQTFMDDPLRVLRLIRFAARLDFTIDATTETYMSDPRVLNALRVKISRERVGVELEKMLKDPSQEEVEAPSASRWHVAYMCLGQILQQRTPKSIADVLIPDDEAAYMAWNLAAVSPWIAIKGPPEQTRKANALPPVAMIAREGFRAPNKLVAVMTACHRNHVEILELKTAVSDKAASIQERDTLGMAIRKWDAQGGMWKSQVLATLLMEAMDRFEAWPMPDESQASSAC